MLCPTLIMEWCTLVQRVMWVSSVHHTPDRLCLCSRTWASGTRACARTNKYSLGVVEYDGHRVGLASQ
jgi:hypothetical protein